ncbi:hypothetical protein RHIZ404_200593 [Rhizobium sp. EC-SD404]|nr:hypothetical protein RHIZ404_200593 [Rhizobium sp. EC-SD404]
MVSSSQARQHSCRGLRMLWLRSTRRLPSIDLSGELSETALDFRSIEGTALCLKQDRNSFSTWFSAANSPR